ncbi:MAG: hypothetical protein COA33_002470 [Fluviicola sp.]|nr:hypothetical protein [Fluviicola sp.]
MTILGFGAAIAKSLAVGKAKHYITSFFKDDRTVFEQQLAEVIDNSKQKYIEEYNPILEPEGDKFTFLTSSKFVENLLEFSFFTSELNEGGLVSGMDEFERLIIPSEKEIENFIEIFKNELEINENLKSLEIKSDPTRLLLHLTKKVTEIGDSIQSAIADINTDLNSEYERELNAFHSDIKEFKPTSALKHLKLLENKLEESGKGSKETRAKIYHLIGDAHGELLENKLQAQYYIKSYHAWLGSVRHKVYGAIGYFESDDFEESKKIIEDILSLEPINPTANALKVAMIPNWMENVPKITVDDPKFRINYGYNLFRNNKAEEAYLLNEEEILDLEGSKIEISQENYRKMFFLAQLALYHSFGKTKSTPMLFWEGKENDPQLNIGIQIFDALIQKLKSSELYDKYTDGHFLLNFAQYHKTGKKEFTKEMERIFEILPARARKIRCESLAVSLAQKGEIERGLEILEDEDFGDSSYNLFVGATLAGVLENSEKVEKYLGKYIDSLDIINEDVAPACFQYISSFFKTPEERVLFLEKLEGKINSNKVYLFLKVAIDLINDSSWGGGNCVELIELLETDDWRLARIIAIILMNRQDYDNAIMILDEVQKVDLLSSNLDVMIDLLYHSQKQTDRLVELLQASRSKPRYIDWYFYEVDLLSIIPDWNNVIEVSKEGLKQYPNDSRLIEYLILGLNKEGKSDEISDTLNEILDLTSWTQSGAFRVAQVLVENDLTDLALEITFPFAKDRQNTPAREMYALMLGRKADVSRYMLNKIESGTVVELIIDGEVEFFDVTETSLINNPRLKLVKDSTVGAILESDRGEKITIASILPPKYGLIRSIFVDIQRRPKAGYSARQFQFNSTDPESMLKEIHKQFDSQDELNRQKKIEEMVQSYNENQESFGSLARNIFRGNHVDCYGFLTQSNRQFNTKPQVRFNGLVLPEDLTYIIDWSTIPLLFDLYDKKLITKYPSKFLISSYVLSDIDDMIKSLGDGHSGISLKFTEDRVIPIQMPENYAEHKTKFLENLKNWVNEFCLVEVVKEKLEVALRLRQNKNFDSNMNYIIDNVFLANRTGHVLLTDDDIYDPFGLISVGHQISSQYYFSTKFSNIWESDILPEMLMLNYRGLSISSRVLIDSYSSISDIKSQKFNSALENLPIKVSMEKHSLGESMKFIKHLYLLDAELGQKRRISTQVLTSVLRGLENLQDMETNAKTLIRVMFALQPAYADSVIGDFEAAIKIINS